MISTLRLENTPRPIEEGDAGIVLTKEGGWFAFNSHAKIDPNNLTERQIEQGRVIQAFSVALQLPQIMAVLLQIADDPKIVSKSVDLGIAN